MNLNHPNGKGKVSGDAEASSDSFVSRRSVISGECIITSSKIVDSHLACRGVHNAVVERCNLVGNVLVQGIGGGTFINNIVASGNVYLGGKLHIRDCVLFANMRIEGGVWERAPRYTEIQLKDYYYGVTDAQKNQAFVGCRRFEMRHLLKKQSLYQKALGFNAEAIKQLAETLENWLDTPVEYC